MFFSCCTALRGLSNNQSPFWTPFDGRQTIQVGLRMGEAVPNAQIGPHNHSSRPLDPHGWSTSPAGTSCGPRSAMSAASGVGEKPSQQVSSTGCGVVIPSHAQSFHVCLICQRAFTTTQGWFLHAIIKHGYRTVPGTVVQGDTCPCCAKVYPLWYTLMCPLGGLLPDIFVRAQTWKSTTFVGNEHFLV